MPKPQKIALVANIAWNLYNFRRGLIKALQSQGYEIILIAAADEYVPQLQAMNCTFIPLQNMSRKGTNPIQDYQLYKELYQIYKDYAPIAVLQYTIKPNIYGTLAAYKAKIPAIATITGLGYTFLNEGLVPKLVRYLYKFALARAEKVIFQNGDDRALFLQGNLVAESKTLLVRGSGIDVHNFQPQQKDTAYKNTFIFLFVGRLLYDKGIREYLQAAEQVKATLQHAVQFKILGALDTENPSALAKEELQKYIDNGIVDYLGTSDKVKEIMGNCDCVVLPSYREGLPRVMLEALSMAKPIITTDAPGCRDTVEDAKNGFCVPVQNTMLLANACTKMYELSDEQRIQMGQAGRYMAEQLFSQEVIVQQYITLLEKYAELPFQKINL